MTGNRDHPREDAGMTVAPRCPSSLENDKPPFRASVCDFEQVGVKVNAK